MDGWHRNSFGLNAGRDLYPRSSRTIGLGYSLDWVTVGRVIVSAILVFRFQINSAWLVLGD
ncbi:MAG: hypothetical protein AB8B99_07140 [Phormidesmis sp.]